MVTTIEVAPTLALRSAATCGSSESMTRTIAWLEKAAIARITIARVGLGSGCGEGEGGRDTALQEHGTARADKGRPLADLIWPGAPQTDSAVMQDRSQPCR